MFNNYRNCNCKSYTLNVSRSKIIVNEKLFIKVANIRKEKRIFDQIRNILQIDFLHNKVQNLSQLPSIFSNKLYTLQKKNVK